MTKYASTFGHCKYSLKNESMYIFNFGDNFLIKFARCFVVGEKFIPDLHFCYNWFAALLFEINFCKIGSKKQKD